MISSAQKRTSHVWYGVSLLTQYDIFLFRQGNHAKLWEKMGAHTICVDNVPGILFSLWAPHAENVAVVGNFNAWDPSHAPLQKRDDGSGIWEGFIPHLTSGELYKYFVRRGGFHVEKADPFAQKTEVPPRTASFIHTPEYSWQDADWMNDRWQRNRLNSPMSIYELHLGSWKYFKEGKVSYRELAEHLVPYLQELGVTHVEIMPLMEHPFYGSWGYQCTSYFAPTARYGEPEECMALIDALHRGGIGVLLDWVPSHFPTDAFGPGFFDGSHLYEYEDMRKGYHKDWHSFIFDYSSGEVRSFLISSALYWLDRYHADGLRVDGVASMLYLDYSRREGEWVPNEYGGRENTEAVHFLRSLNTLVYKKHPDVQMIAEESTAWPMVSKPIYLGGLGFGMKWNMGWMHDTLSYFSSDPIYRKYKHHELTFSLLYAYAENFCLSLSHDEVVHGKGSIYTKMPGDEWQKRAQMRLLYGFMYGHPGKKLLFMGSEFGQKSEWYHEEELHWYLLEDFAHKGLFSWVRDLNHVYKTRPALYEEDFSPMGFQWIDCHDADQSVISFLRISSSGDHVLVICNMTPIPRESYRVGVDIGGTWREILNSDASMYGGSGWGNYGKTTASLQMYHGRPYSLSLSLPPFGSLFLEPCKEEEELSL